MGKSTYWRICDAANALDGAALAIDADRLRAGLRARQRLRRH
jgi:hypothetical protein